MYAYNTISISSDLENGQKTNDENVHKVLFDSNSEFSELKYSKSSDEWQELKIEDLHVNGVKFHNYLDLNEVFNNSFEESSDDSQWIYVIKSDVFGYSITKESLFINDIDCDLFSSFVNEDNDNISNHQIHITTSLTRTKSVPDIHEEKLYEISMYRGMSLQDTEINK